MAVMTARRCAVICALILVGSAAGARADETFSVDIVADCNRFISEGVGHPHPGPVFGDYFMQEGLIYEGGTLSANCAGGDGCGLNPDGTAEFPEAVIGKWTCYGSFVGNGGATVEACGFTPPRSTSSMSSRSSRTCSPRVPTPWSASGRNATT